VDRQAMVNLLLDYGRLLGQVGIDNVDRPE
jgi:hypothetical protein